MRESRDFSRVEVSTDNTADEKDVVDMLTMVDCIEKRGEKRGERLGKQLSQARMQKLILSLAADNKSEDIIESPRTMSIWKKCTKNMVFKEVVASFSPT